MSNQRFRLNLLVPIFTGIFYGLNLLGCTSPNQSGITPSPDPFNQNIQTGQASTLDEFVQGQVGVDYFTAHYRADVSKIISPTLIKATYIYTYPPILDEYIFVVFFDPTIGTLSQAEYSTILLQPQKLQVTLAQAQTLATQNGLTAITRLEAVMEFDPDLQRFVWRVTDPSLAATGQIGQIYRVDFDAETGILVGQRKVEPITIP